MKAPKIKIKYLDAEQIREIIRGIPATESGLMYKTLIVVLFTTGLRISEALNLKIKDLKLDSKITQELAVVGKGGYTRTVYFSPDTLKMIKKWLSVRKGKKYNKPDKRDRVFPVSVRSVQKQIKKWADWAGFEATPHTFRHSFAVHTLSKLGNLRFTQEFLGHKSILNTQIYTQITNKHLRKAHEEIFT